MAATVKYVGRAMKRREDPRLIQGQARYVDDLRFVGMCHAVFVRSPYAHAVVRSIDASKAQAKPGVVAVLSADELGGAVGPTPCAAQIPGMKVALRPALASERVRFVGEAVAVVVAEDLMRARDAAELVQVDYEPLAAVVNPEKALRKDAVVLHPSYSDNRAYVWELEGGDVRQAFQQADRVVRLRMTSQRQIPVAMEPRGVVADYQAGDAKVTLWSSTQIPHLLRTQVAAMLGVPEYSVHVITPEVGGGFGSKLNVYPEEGIIAHLAMRLGRPVKWIESRRENFQCTIHGRDIRCDLELAFRRDGTVLGLKTSLLADLGAYDQLLTPLIPTMTGLMICGCYRIPAARISLTAVFTNKMATDAYRGAGRPEATYFIERAMDLAARELGRDPVELRRKNFPRSADFPYATPTGLVYDSADYQRSLDKALKLADYRKLRAEQARLRRQGRLIGIGLSTYVEVCAMGPSSAMPAGGWESATVRIEPTGKVTVLSGASPHGQGQETSFTQIAADILGISPADVFVAHGDTNAVPYGIGTFGSRGTAVGGTAVYQSLVKLRTKLAAIAGHILREDPRKLVFRAGHIASKANPRKSVRFAEAVGAAYTAKTLPAGTEPGMEATSFFEPANFTFPFGAHIAVVEIDRETGDVLLRDYFAVDDCGNVINPLLVEGQVQGGIVQAIGQALLEEAIYDDQGQLLTGELTDYALPRAGDIPRLKLDRTVTPTHVNPMGVKGIGEAGTIGATPAIVNAVVDALAPFGVRHVEMPLKRERIWRLLARVGPRPGIKPTRGGKRQVRIRAQSRARRKR